MRVELRNTTNELREVEEEEADIKKSLNTKLIEIEKLKKELSELRKIGSYHLNKV